MRKTNPGVQTKKMKDCVNTMKKLLKISNIGLFCLLYGFWLLLSSDRSIGSLLIGAAVALGIVVFQTDQTEEQADIPNLRFLCKKALLLVKFFCDLTVEMVKANFLVASIVLRPTMPISPRFVKVPAFFESDGHKVLYANAITLTPGTLTIDVTEDGFIVHALTDKTAASLFDSCFERDIKKMEAIRHD